MFLPTAIFVGFNNIFNKIGSMQISTAALQTTATIPSDQVMSQEVLLQIILHNK